MGETFYSSNKSGDFGICYMDVILTLYSKYSRLIPASIPTTYMSY